MISVVLAAYNGEKYIEEQINSILMQLSVIDELLISDDGSVDETISIVHNIMQRDDRVKLLKGPHKGFVRNFEHAISHCRGDIIFFSDQDDIWLENKVCTIMKCFEQNADISCIRHNAIVIDTVGNVLIESYNKFRKSNVGYIRNIIKNTFTGCCMAMRSDWVNKLLPIPEGIFHDVWLGCLSCYFNKAVVIEDKLIKWRRHENNVTDVANRRKLGTIISERKHLYKNLRKKIKALKN